MKREFDGEADKDSSKTGGGARSRCVAVDPRNRYISRKSTLVEGSQMIRRDVEKALSKARYEKLEDGTYSGEIPACPGTIAFGYTEEECRRELEMALEDWLLSALRHGDALPVIDAGGRYGWRD